MNDQNQRNGFGRSFYYDGQLYEGLWKNDKRYEKCGNERVKWMS